MRGGIRFARMKSSLRAAPRCLKPMVYSTKLPYTGIWTKQILSEIAARSSDTSEEFAPLLAHGTGRDVTDWAAELVRCGLIHRMSTPDVRQTQSPASALVRSISQARCTSVIAHSACWGTNILSHHGGAK